MVEKGTVQVARNGKWPDEVIFHVWRRIEEEKGYFQPHFLAIGLICSFSSLLIWIFGMFWSIASTEHKLLLLDQQIEMRSLWLIFEGVGLIIAFGCFLRGVSTRKFVWMGSILALCGTIPIVFGGQSILQVHYVLCLGIAGIGSSFLMLQTAVEFSKQHAHVVLCYAGISLVGAAGCDLLFNRADTLVQAMILGLLPAGYLVLFIPLVLDSKITCVKSVSSKLSSLQNMTEGEEKKKLVSYDRFVYQAFFPKPVSFWMVVLPFVVGLSFGLMQYLSEHTLSRSALSADVETIVSFAVSGLVLIFASRAVQKAGVLRLIYAVGLPIVGVSFLMLPSEGNVQTLSLWLCVVGFNTFYFLVWALCAPCRDQAGKYRITLLILALTAGEGMGLVISQYVNQAWILSPEILALIALFVIYALIIVALQFMKSGDLIQAASRYVSEEALSGRKHSETAQSSPNEQSHYVFDNNLMDEIAQQITSYYGLSLRESEVFRLLAKGRSRAFISKTLFISDNTTRTHMRSIYRKLGVHSQQELISLIENKTINRG